MSNTYDKNKEIELYRELGMEDHYLKIEHYKDKEAIKQEFHVPSYNPTKKQIHAVKVAEFIVFYEKIKKGH